MSKLERKQKYLEYIIFAGVLFILCFFLHRYVIYTVNSDASSELVLAKHLIDNGEGILSKNWYYSTEITLLSDQLIYRLMFSFTDNWRTVRTGGSILLVVTMLAGLYYFCRETVGKRWFPLTATVVMLPLSRLYFDMVYKFTYYIPFLIIGFVVIGAGMQFAEESRKRRYLVLGMGMLLSLAAGLMGFRMLLTLYIPLVMAMIMYLWLNKVPEKGKDLVAATGMLTVAAAVGAVINQTVIIKNYAVYNYSTLDFSEFSFDGFEKEIRSLLTILGYRSGESLFSQALLPNVLSLILLILSMYCVIYVICNRGRFAAQQQIAAYFYLCSVMALGLLYCLTTMQCSAYHSIQAAVHGLPLIFMCFGDKEFHGRTGRKIILGIICLTLLWGAIHYNDMRKEDETRGQRECAKYLVDNGYTCGYASFWNGNVMTELSNGKLEMWVWEEQCAQLEDPDKIVTWLQSKTHDQPPSQGKVFVLLSANEDYYCEFAANLGQDNIVFKTSAYTEGAIDEYIIYGFDSYDEMRSLFMEGIKEK